MITGNEFVTRLQRKLDDEGEEIWSRDFLMNAGQDGYDRLCRAAECIFDMQMFDNQPQAGNHTRDFEADYMPGPVLGRFNYTRESEREYVTEGSRGPMDHTRPSDATFMTDPNRPSSPRTLGRLISRFVTVDRVTHDWLKLEPELDRYLRLTKTEYQTLQGGVYSYSMDQDGLFWLRTVGVPVSRLPVVSISGIYGPLRRITDYGLDQELVLGNYGAIRSLPRQFSTGSQYGMIRRIVPDDDATRVELFRLGNPITEHPFEIPDRAVRYIEWWTMYRAFSEPGEGENAELADHFRQRFENGLAMIKRRVNAINRERTMAMGAKRLTKRDNYLEMFPSDFGYKRPFRG